LQGDILLVGAVTDGELGYFAGAAYVYHYDGTTWVEQAKLLASDGKPNDCFGSAIAFAGDTAVVGAYGSLSVNAGGVNMGAAYVYRGLSDCNSNGVLDLCEVAGGVGRDRNDNGLPDDCEPFPLRLSRNTSGQDEDLVLGPPDDQWHELAGGSVVEYDWGDARVIDGDGPDFNVYEFQTGKVEFELIRVQVSRDGTSYEDVRAVSRPDLRIDGDGERGGSGAFIRSYDLSGTGLSNIRYVKITALDDGYRNDGIGFELDAIGAIHLTVAQGN
jgi:hypothetical protein